MVRSRLTRQIFTSFHQRSLPDTCSNRSKFEKVSSDMQTTEEEEKMKQIQKYSYKEGDVYEGGWSPEGKKHGLGLMKFKNGSVYEGIFRNGVFHGFGQLTMEDQTTYEGEFYEGKFHGFGVYTRCDGMQYEGRFCDGSPKGAGLITFPDGSHGNPRQEGYYEGKKLVKSMDVSQDLMKARRSAERGRSCKVGGHIS